MVCPFADIWIEPVPVFVLDMISMNHVQIPLASAIFSPTPGDVLIRPLGKVKISEHVVPGLVRIDADAAPPGVVDFVMSINTKPVSGGAFGSLVGLRVAVGVGVLVGVWVIVGVIVAVGVSVIVGELVGVGVIVGVDVFVGVFVWVGVFVGVKVKRVAIAVDVLAAYVA